MVCQILTKVIERLHIRVISPSAFAIGDIVCIVYMESDRDRRYPGVRLPVQKHEFEVNVYGQVHDLFFSFTLYRFLSVKS